MAVSATMEESAVAFLFDFSADFPSVEHELLHSHFAALGWPHWFLRFVLVLYQLYRFFIAMEGARFDGFKITRGIRQSVVSSMPSTIRDELRTFYCFGFEGDSRWHASKLKLMNWLSLTPRASLAIWRQSS